MSLSGVESPLSRSPKQSRLVRFGTKADSDFLLRHDPGVKMPVLQSKIRDHQVYIVEVDKQIVGWARYNLLWDVVPFLSLIYILNDRRREGHGKALMTFWEAEMAKLGHRHLLTSTQADEQAQFFYRALGFRDCGALFFPTQLPVEIFLVKDVEAQR